MKKVKRLFLFLSKVILYSYIFIFPFGQLLRSEVVISAKLIPILGIDIIVAFSLLISLFIRKNKLQKYLNAFYLTSLFSLLISLSLFPFYKVVIGSLYLIRLMAHLSLSILAWNLIKEKQVNREGVLSLIILMLIFICIVGWIQYFYFFDLTFLKFVGWDDHLGRLTGIFLDPGFSGIIILAGFIIVFLRYIENEKIIDLILSLFFLITVLFTYSRATYVAYLFLIVLIFYIKRKTFIFLTFLSIFIFATALLPRTKGEGVRLERTKSIVLRIENYRETLEFIKSYPLFGVGFNNMCWIKESKYNVDLLSHSCSGSDSSLLLLIATTGFLGFIIFLSTLFNIRKDIRNDYYGDIVRIYFLSVAIHSMFSNSLFYSWVLGLLALFLGMAIKDSKLQR